ncbi:MAG: SDR family oxidoreductase [Candidatus Rokubacteria bacterium]|nr:SDR family oxidoreductase [Candidatus Rokubacteria bacterium]
MRLTDTVAIVTGSARGIGRAIAVAFAEAGADLALADTRAAELEAVAAEVRALGRHALAQPADVTREDEVERLVARTLAEYGRVDVLVNNAGTIVLPGAILETTVEAWDTMMATNARSVFLCARAVLPGMLARRRGTIVNVGSTAGLRPLPGRAAYCASKHAVTGFTTALALDLRPHGIAVNAICPGAVDTPLTRYSRPDADRSGWLQPPDVAEVAVFLASDAARGMTGAVVEVAGWAD